MSESVRWDEDRPWLAVVDESLPEPHVVAIRWDDSFAVAWRADEWPPGCAPEDEGDPE